MASSKIDRKYFSPALFRSVKNIGPSYHGVIHLTSFPCQQSLISMPTWREIQNIPIFVANETDCTYKQFDESNYHKNSVFARSTSRTIIWSI